MAEGKDTKYMQRALELASKGRGNTSPNPMVGAVIVSDDKIIGEGYHTQAGSRHAEIMAIESVARKDLLKRATMYVSLEPCSHYGKTPPCAARIIEEGIPRVVVASDDPSKRVGGKGIAMLQDAGVEVTRGILDSESRELNSRFFTFHDKGRPYIILKWAESSDGFLDRIRTDNRRGPNWITGREEKILVHKWRSEEDAILVGYKTACNDDPHLDVRLWGGRSPKRFVISEHTELPPDLRIFSGKPETVIFTPGSGKGPVGAVYKKIKSRNTAVSEMMAFFRDNNIQSLIIEGGCTVLSQFINAGLWDEARIFRGKLLFGDGLKAPLIEGDIIDSQAFKVSRLEYLVPKKQSVFNSN